MNEEQTSYTHDQIIAKIQKFYDDLELYNHAIQEDEKICLKHKSDTESDDQIKEIYEEKKQLLHNLQDRYYGIFELILS